MYIVFTIFVAFMIDYRIYSSNIEDFVEYLNKAYNMYVSHTYLTYNNVITVYTFTKISFYSWTANRVWRIFYTIALIRFAANLSWSKLNLNYVIILSQVTQVNIIFGIYYFCQVRYCLWRLIKFSEKDFKISSSFLKNLEKLFEISSKADYKVLKIELLGIEYKLSMFIIKVLYSSFCSLQ